MSPAATLDPAARAASASGSVPLPTVERGPDPRPAVRWARAERLAIVPVLLLAAVLRLWRLGRVPDDPFYDAAVRSMGGSWHLFVTGAMDPSGIVAVDKPPVDLWLQVASTRVLGFTPTALHLPEALGGTLAVFLLYDALRVLFGRAAGLAGAGVLTVLPMAVVTARSDTMDSVMAALVLGALALSARAAAPGRSRRSALGLVCGAGALLGLAFEVKLFEGLLAVPALAALWWFGAGCPRRERATALAASAACFLVVALAWLSLSSLAGGPRPWAFGSTNGSAWNATFVYDGLDRLRGGPGAAAHHVLASPGLAPNAAPAPPGPLRLLDGRALVGERFGLLAAAAVVAALFALAAGASRELDRRGRAGWFALVGWLGTGLALFSVQGGLKPRYLEAVDPALAGVLGVAVVLVARRLVRGRRLGPAGAALALAAVLVLPTVTTLRAVASHAEDAGAPGALAPARTAQVSAFLRAHRFGSRYEAATVSVGKMASLVAYDGQRELPLTSTAGRPLVSVPALAAAAARGDVRYALVGGACSPASPDRVTGCSPAARWIRSHGVDVSRAAGQRAGLVYALVS